MTPWTLADLADLALMVRTGHSDADIARVLGRSRKAIRARRQYLGLASAIAPGPRRRLDHAELHRLVRIEGLTCKAAAERVGANPSWVARVVAGTRA